MARFYWTVHAWEIAEPYDFDVEKQQLKTLCWELNLDEDGNYTMEELKEIKKEQANEE